MSASSPSCADTAPIAPVSTSPTNALLRLLRTTPAALVGQLLAGRYLVREHLGSGGQGSAYTADDHRQSRRVVLKLLHAGEGERNARRRFEREANVLLRVVHPGIPRCLGWLEVHGVPCLIMEHVDGVALDLLPPPTVDEATAVGRELLDILAEVHRHGIVHRDVNCANVLLARSGCVTLIDFGIASGVADSRLTHEGVAIGTAHSMAPEQARCEAVDSRADLYATGALLFELLVGRPVVDGAGIVAVAAVAQGRIERHPAKFRPTVPAWLDAVVARALAHDPGQRYPSAGAMQASLRASSSRISDDQRS